MKTLFVLIISVFCFGNIIAQNEKAKEKSKEKEQVVEEAPPPPVVEELIEYGGIDATLVPAPPAGIQEPDGDEPFDYVEQMPSFPEGTQAMYKFIYETLQYPEIAKQNSISGQVILQFVISSEGIVKNAKVMRGIGGGCNEEALRIVNAMPRWNPGKHNGRNVPVTFTLPIKFVLQ